MIAGVADRVRVGHGQVRRSVRGKPVVNDEPVVPSCLALRGASSARASPILIQIKFDPALPREPETILAEHQECAT